ncbi:glycoside hydrolase family 18 protein [Chondrinema litorale]|uniref:glycoside hydrolase family 18 protein n=1 Tax=Chondrinema litorale TaxID=2994555 RepID=UPI0025437A24|nr:glycoside hydrolase family 18 protein [Chondrinema litorale]UZR97403.1 glycoside hydrolase family 18 protein [Chondrinema litorale]
MTRLILLLLALSIFSCSHEKPVETTDAESDPQVVVMAYYVPEKDYQPEKIPVEELTHIIYSFTNVIDGEMKFRNPEVAGKKLKQLVDQKKRNPKLKVMIACGGWGADGFSDMASTPENQKKFISSVYDFVQEYKLDGLDIDWEYPAIPAANTEARDEDKQNFTQLMKGLRAVLDSTGRPQTLTFASAGWKRYYDNIEMLEVLKYANYMNIMTYDQVNGNSIYTGHHTPLGNVKREDIVGTPFQNHLDSLFEAGRMKDPNPRSSEKIVDFLIKEGANPKQLVIGSAFYGRAWKGVPPENNGLYQLSSGIHIGWSAYHHIRKEFEPDSNYVRYWDEKAKAPYLYNATDSIMVSYDDTVSVRLKTEYTIEKGLGGIMFWELGNDTKEEGTLLHSIYEAATKESAKVE